METAVNLSSASPGVSGDFPLLPEHCRGAVLADVGGPACRVSDEVPPEGFGAVPTPRAPQALPKGAPRVLSNPLPQADWNLLSEVTICLLTDDSVLLRTEGMITFPTHK